MDAVELKQVAEWLQAAGLSSLEIEGPGSLLRLSVPAGEANTPQAVCIKAAVASTVGAFLDSHPLRMEPFAQIGSMVESGEIVGLVKNGRILTPVVAPLGGTVTRILAAPGTMVDYGKPILEISAHLLCDE